MCVALQWPYPDRAVASRSRCLDRRLASRPSATQISCHPFIGPPRYSPVNCRIDSPKEPGRQRSWRLVDTGLKSIRAGSRPEPAGGSGPREGESHGGTEAVPGGRGGPSGSAAYETGNRLRDGHGGSTPRTNRARGFAHCPRRLSVRRREQGERVGPVVQGGTPYRDRDRQPRHRQRHHLHRHRAQLRGRNSESIIGEVMKTRRLECVLTTKVSWEGAARTT